MNAGLFDVFHDSADDHVGSVADAIDINFNCVVEKPVQQDGRLLRDLHGLSHVALEVLVAVHDLHRAATEHIAGAHHKRVADFLREQHGLFFGARSSVRRLLQIQPMQQLLETLAIFGDVNAVGRRADDRHARAFQVERKFQRRLAAVLNDHTLRPFLVDDFKHVFKRHRFEVQPVRSVIVGRHSLGVAVDHDGLVTILAHRQCSMDAAVIEFDALSDPVRPAAEHHDLAAFARLGFALLFVRGVHVGGLSCEFGRAGIDAFVDRSHAKGLTTRPHIVLIRDEQLRQPFV